MTNRLLLLLALLWAPLSACAADNAIAPATTAAQKGAVSAADPRAAAAGIEILRAGGNAADAAAAIMLALTVVEPQSSGIGGGGFIVYHDAASGKVSSFDGRERAPAAATPAYFLDANGQPRSRGDAIPGGLSIGVPGNIRLIALAHQEHGKLPWARLFEPAIRLARDGFAITPRLYRALSSPNSPAGSTAWGRAYFYTADGQAKAVGTTLRNPELAETLERLARLGPDSFYVGPNAEALVRTARGAARNPAVITTGDLASYEAKERPAVCGSYRGYRICGMGPPSSGATTVFEILKQLERFDLAAFGPQSPAAWHLIAESMRLAYADREAFIGDPDFVRVPVSGLTDPSYLAQRSRLISPDRAMAEAVAGTPPGGLIMTPAPSGEVPATTHFAVADARGNVASYTSTVEGAFGSGLMSGGYVLNNELTDFSFVPERGGARVANRVEAGKRPMSAMSPTIVYAPDGAVRIAIGAAGGPTIIAQVAKALIGVIDWKLSAQEAIALPFIMGIGDNVLVERGTALEAMIPALQALGDKAVAAAPPLKANALERVDGRWVGAADPRSEGVWLSE